jgi:molybdopterin synthase catalytic subunit
MAETATGDGVCVEVSAEPLSLDRYVTAVADDGAGAIATFIGVTRNTFEGKRVARLEYEAYVPMARARWRGRGQRAGMPAELMWYRTRTHAWQAVKELLAVCARMRERWDVRKVAIAHRTGVVPVGEASVIVAVSSAHRREALEATQYGIDELKARARVRERTAMSQPASVTLPPAALRSMPRLVLRRASFVPQATVPIWKKEIYEDNAAGAWKANAEALTLQGR